MTHLMIFIVSLVAVFAFFLWRIHRSKKVNKAYGDYSFDFTTPLWWLGMIVVIVVMILIYGGIYWW